MENYTNNDNQNQEVNKTNDESTNNLMSSSYYSESYKKPARKGNSILQLILVATVSSVIGGTAVGAFFQFVTPNLEPSVKGYFNKFLQGNSAVTNTVQVGQPSGYKKVEITQSDSPVSAVAEKVSPSIVGIRVSFKSENFFFGEQSSKGEGSGIIVRSDGYIMTNYHVVEQAVGSNSKVSDGSKIEVFLPNQKDTPYQAKLVGGDSKTDLAVIKIEANDLPAVEMGNSDELKIGEMAIAIGNPGGLEYMGSVTVGVISGLNRTIPLEDNKELKLVQTDAAINPGNSGGALLNSRGQVIGVNTAKIGATGYEGLGFAIPINKAKEITDSLIEFKYVKGRPLLGISIDTRFNEDIAKRYDVPMGVLVADVSPLSGAYKAGLQKGDIITKFAGTAVKSNTELDEIKNKHKPDDVIDIEVYRDGETKTFSVKLTEDKG